MHADLHQAFRDPRRAPAAQLERFLADVDDLDGIRAMRDAVALARGGRLVLFELDYGATILAPGRSGEQVVRRACALLDGSLPQPRAGRRIPALLADRGMRDISARPCAFAVSEPVWHRIVYATLAPMADPELLAYLDDVADAPFLASFTGILTTARC